ncbi:MAG: hypothetical protein IKR23_00550 [Lachnospiraceae bacterium]|nr:hypothetical protein [Lachnospiraceae bacterium]
MDEPQKIMSPREFTDKLAELGGGKAFEKAFSDEALKAAGIDMDAPRLTRIDAAIMLHKYMLEVAGIPDLEDISGAAVLKDLYDCRKCVNHIAQVYLRGLMKPVSYPLPDGSSILLFDAKSEDMSSWTNQQICGIMP